VVNRKYSDVGYHDRLYLDAELIDGIWYFEDGQGALHAFSNQQRVKPKYPPILQRRHPPDRSGHSVPL
jgi:hypothetical protein